MSSVARCLSLALAVVAAQGPLAAEGTLERLDSVEQLRQMFNEDQGKPRLVLLLSPT